MTFATSFSSFCWPTVGERLEDEIARSISCMTGTPLILAMPSRTSTQPSASPFTARKLGLSWSQSVSGRTASAEQPISKQKARQWSSLDSPNCGMRSLTPIASSRYPKQPIIWMPKTSCEREAMGHDSTARTRPAGTWMAPARPERKRNPNKTSAGVFTGSMAVASIVAAMITSEDTSAVFRPRQSQMGPAMSRPTPDPAKVTAGSAERCSCESL
mmetsp:Transcript_107680/g.286640  ORF Transcript_107680/g.286640 Transcript_107680/m.286640 type:complete len:215 (+) Transcript_107680:922-1566(+)